MSTPTTVSAGSTAETQAAAFASDPRIHFDKSSGTWRFEDDNDDEFEFDAAKGAWVPLVDEDLVKAQQAAYSVVGVDEETPAAPVLAREKKKRKQPEDYTSNTLGVEPGPSLKRGKKGNGKDKEKKSKNTAVYVTGLPLDTDPDELVERFSKFGLIEEDDGGEPKIKMYARDDGTFSGEALVVYFKEESVMLAVNILDEAELRLGDPSTRMAVAKAEFGHKHDVHSGGGDRPRKTMDKKKATRRIGKMQKKLGEWVDEDGFGPAITEEDKAQTAIKDKDSRVVVLKPMFTLAELEEDARLLLELKEDVRHECSTLGEVTSVILYDKEPEGVMTVKFRDPLSAQACVIKMNGRFFSGKRIEAFIYTGKQRFKRSGASNDYGDGGDEGEKKRLDDFAQWLMAEGD